MVLVPGKEYFMSNLIPGNQKHLTLDNRVFIEKCLDQSMTMKDIAKPLCKDFLPDTCSRLLRAPFVCNGCPSKAGCRKDSFPTHSPGAVSCYDSDEPS